MTDKEDTKTKILNAAESLFAQRGFTDTSLRLITNQAEVNLASVNYHFGSKKTLIKAVLGRYLEVFMPHLDKELQALLQTETKPSMNQVFETFIEPLLCLNQLQKEGTASFLKLLGRGYSDSQGHLRWFITTQYADVLNRFTQLIYKAKPELPASEVFWRLHFTLGTAVFAMASSEALQDIAKVDFNQDVDIEGVVRKVIPFLAAGVDAKVTE